jgi:hypothetical protein
MCTYGCMLLLALRGVKSLASLRAAARARRAEPQFGAILVSSCCRLLSAVVQPPLKVACLLAAPLQHSVSCPIAGRWSGSISLPRGLKGWGSVMALV